MAPIPLGVLPALLGFSITAFVLLLTIGSDDYRAFLQSVNSKTQPLTVFERTAGIFAHFIVVEVIALAAAIVGDAHPLRGQAHNLPLCLQGPAVIYVLKILATALSFVAYLLFALSVTTSLAAGFAILALAKWYGDYLDRRSLREDASCPERELEHA